MNPPPGRSAYHILLLAGTLLTAGCTTGPDPTLEVLDASRARTTSLAVSNDFHRDNSAIEERLAADLRDALTRRGFTLTEDPAEADLVILPTLGRMRDPASGTSTASDRTSAARATASPISAPTSPITQQPRLTTRHAVPSARHVASAQRLGLLLTAVPSADYQRYGVQHQVLTPIWRIYVSRPAGTLRWNTAARPLIDAAARAASTLAAEVPGEERKKKSKKIDEATEKPPEARLPSESS